MKYSIIGSSISILCVIIMNQMKMGHGSSSLPNTRSHSNLSHYSTKMFTKIHRRPGRFHKKRIRYNKGALDHLKAISADHNERKAAFFQKELEICFSQMEKYHQSTTNFVPTSSKRDDSRSSAPTVRTADSYISTTATSRRSPEVGKRTKAMDLHVSTTRNSGGSSEVVTHARQESGNLEEQKDHNVEKLITFWRKEQELRKKEIDFLTEPNFVARTGAILLTFRHEVLTRFEKFYKSYLPKVITYEDVAEKMKASFSPSEIGHADLLLYVMEELNLIQRNRTTTEKMIPPLPMDILEHIITPRIAHWMLFLLFGQHSSLSTLRREVESEPHLTLYKFCWSISKIWDLGNGIEVGGRYGMIPLSHLQVDVEAFMDDLEDAMRNNPGDDESFGGSKTTHTDFHDESKRPTLSLGPFWRSIKLLVKKFHIL